MKIAFYSTKQYDRESFEQANFSLGSPLQFSFFDPRLTVETALLAQDHEAVCLFVNDDAGADTLEELHRIGIKHISFRCAGTDNADLDRAKSLGIRIIHVPSYSPEAVAEFAVGMILLTIRKYHKAYNRAREGNFMLAGLVGFNLQGKTIGIIGTGRIGLTTAKILSRGFSSKVIAYDPFPNEQAAEEYGFKYVATLDELLDESDIVSLHCPLTKSTHHILNHETLPKLRKGAVLINVARGALINTKALIHHLKTGHIGAVGLDVYEGEAEYFFHDSSSKIIQDDELSRLMSFHNVVITGHQAFLTKEALHSIATQSIQGLIGVDAHTPTINE